METKHSSAAGPMLGIWFGNFFEPFYSDRESVRLGIEDVSSLGFTSLNLDSKPWEDFFVRYRGGPASAYVSMQEYMMAEAARRGLDYTNLALYLCGDNLYPNIRDVPPVRGEESIRPDGSPMGTYKYWSPKAQDTMVEHVLGLLKLYGAGMRRGPEGRIIMQTMFDPIPKPSFDAEGRARYLAWLEKRYEGDVSRLNKRYGLSASSFSSLEPEQYWLRPGELSWVECAHPTREDFETRSADFQRWLDNQSYLAAEMESFFASMKKRWREVAPELFIEPVLHQWGYFFNPPGQTSWPTAKRGLDMYRVAPHVDGVLFIAAPLNAENRADARALSVEGSLMRCTNAGRRFTAGLYLGRHVNGDIYSVVPPAEAVGTLVAAGCSGMHDYGYSGLDDGGVMYRMDSVFKDSLRTGNLWASEVIPLLKAPRAKEMAMLFPAEMSLYEPLSVDEEGRHRMDLLGWYSQLTDLGWHVDILHPDQVKQGALREYRALVVPHNSLYDVGDNKGLEEAVRSYVEQGGLVVHGPGCELAKRVLAVVEHAHPFDCIAWEEEVIPHGWSTVSYEGGETLGAYIGSKKSAFSRRSLGSGTVVSLGFEYGHAYTRASMPIVPPQYGRREMHPIVLLKRTPLEGLLGVSPLVPLAPGKGLEFARFGKDALVIVNHRSVPLDVRSLKARKAIHQVPSAPGYLAGHSAAYFQLS